MNLTTCILIAVAFHRYIYEDVFAKTYSRIAMQIGE